jgi:hypothetical protein
VDFVTEPLGGKLDGVASLYWTNLEQRPMDKLPVRSFDLRSKSPWGSLPGGRPTLLPIRVSRYSRAAMPFS